jgi:hypothetical protein
MDQPPVSPMALEAELRRELATGERVLWSGQPLAKRLKGGFGIWLFAVPWTLFALFWESMALLPWSASTKTPDGITWTFGIIMPIFGLPFIAIGLWMLWTPIRAMRQAGQTLYALTDRRIVRLVSGRKRELHSVLLDQIGPINRSELPDGTGHLRIETHSTTDSDGDRRTERFEVLGVPGVARLERLILDNRTG